MTAVSFIQMMFVYKKKRIFYFLYRKRRLDTKSEDAIGLEPMETPMTERKTNVYFDDSDGTPLLCFKVCINHYHVKNTKYLLKIDFKFENKISNNNTNMLLSKAVL